MGRRIAVVVAAAVVIAAGLASPAPSQTGPPSVPDAMRAYSIVPPGQEGTVTAAEFAAENFGAHFQDQLDMYAEIASDPDISASDLGKFFHSMQFGVEGEPERTYGPAEGVTVYRDRYGIPHIYADSLESASFALGYVSAEDRLFQMDVFRNAARGTLAEFVGPGDDREFVAMDIATRREGYTEPEVQNMFDQLDDRHGAVGERIQAGLVAYADGVNEYITDLYTDPTLYDERPVEYEATLNPGPARPEMWSPLDTLFLAILQLRVFGETAGGELENAGLYAHLVGRLGPRLGVRAYNDFLAHNYPGSPTSIAPGQARFPAQSLGRIDRRSFVIPDDAVELARSVGEESEVRARVLAGLGMVSPASNAILVSGRESRTGNPLQWGAPQVGYAVPQFFIDVDVHAPGVHFRGPAVPGASALIPLGRGVDYAWSLTTGFSDAVDVRVEKLCRLDGEEPTVGSVAYMFKGECRPMMSRTETFVVKPTPTSPEQPEIFQETIYRTLHGPVFARGTVDEQPVAFVKERFFWMHEIDSIPQFYRWNTSVSDVGDFRAAASRFSMSFNAFYADARDIGYFHVGYLPVRTRHVHPSLPIWGTGRWEWQGRRSFRLQPQVVNPRRGWVVNWNNKPSTGWDNFDGYKWGPIQRVQLLEDGMRRLLAGPRKAALADIVDVAITAGTQDPRGVYLAPRMLRWAGGAVRKLGKGADAAHDFVARWVARGAHRQNRNRDELMDQGPALVMLDRWYDVQVNKVFPDELGEAAFGFLPRPSGYTPTSGSSFFFDFSSYLDRVFRGATNLSYCDNRDTRSKETCTRMVAASFAEAYRQLVDELGPAPANWTAPAENIVFSAQGAGSVPPIPWQNRGTHNHAVEILRDLSP